MIKKLITAIIVILVVLAAALVFVNYTNHNNSTDNSINSSNPEKQISTTSTSNNTNAPTKSTSNTAKSQNKISPEEANKIAQNHIEEPGLTAGTPVLTTKKDGDIYIPIINTKNRTSAGYVAIDAQTGNFMDKGTP